MDWSFRKNWDEFTWGREIRKDEMRICGYFRTLPSCLDLPGEDEMIFKRLMAQPELVPTGVADPERMLKEEFEFADEDPEPDNDVRRCSYDAERRVRNLVVEWNMYTAYKFPADDLRKVMPLTCAFGKLLSRIFNYTDTEEAEDTLNLRISLLKRMLADINEVLEKLDLCCSEGLINHTELARFQHSLNLVREYTVDLIRDLRSGEKA